MATEVQRRYKVTVHLYRRNYAFHFHLNRDLQGLSAMLFRTLGLRARTHEHAHTKTAVLLLFFQR